MSRKARQKHPEAIFHIMCRSISEILLFRDDSDKDYYLTLLKRYIDKFKCSIYAYCLMDNHLHLHFDPQGFDVSRFMLCINTAYAYYYNKKYKRHGHVFQGRFESRILDTDEYNLAVSAYIHNNPHDIPEFSMHEEDYKYSSYGIYLGIRPDLHKLINKSFLKGLFNVSDEKKFAKKYFDFVSRQRDTGSFRNLKIELSSFDENEYINCRNIILRDLSPAKVLSHISSRLSISEIPGILTKNSKQLIDFRSFSAYVLRVLCGFGYKEICNRLHNLTLSGCSRLCNRGYNLLRDKNPLYLSIFEELLNFAA